jgi:hypothetical protein
MIWRRAGRYRRDSKRFREFARMERVKPQRSLSNRGDGGDHPSMIIFDYLRVSCASMLQQNPIRPARLT